MKAEETPIWAPLAGVVMVLGASHRLLGFSRANCGFLFRPNRLETRGDIVVGRSARPSQNLHFHSRVGSCSSRVDFPRACFRGFFHRRLTDRAVPLETGTPEIVGRYHCY